MEKRDFAVVELGRWLRSKDYRFVCPTPVSHGLVNARPENAETATLDGIFGWSRPFRPLSLPRPALDLMRAADAVESDGDRLRCSLRFSTLGDLLLVHSAFPTTQQDAVFFGPDTYRFARVLRDIPMPRGRVLDVGCGSGAGGLALARRGPVDLVLSDINRRALRYSRINAELNGLSVHIVASDILRDIDGRFDLIVSNAPYLSYGPLYCNGGALGLDIPLRIAGQAIERLVPGGRLVLYTGAPVVTGLDRFFESVAPLLRGHAFSYEEIDPDVFGEELATPAYAEVDRIAAVALYLTKVE